MLGPSSKRLLLWKFPFNLFKNKVVVNIQTYIVGSTVIVRVAYAQPWTTELEEAHVQVPGRSQ